MYWDVKIVKPLPDYRLYVEIEDGRKGIFSLKPYLDHGVFVNFKMCITSTGQVCCSVQLPGPTSKTLRRKSYLPK